MLRSASSWPQPGATHDRSSLNLRFHHDGVSPPTASVTRGLLLQGVLWGTYTSLVPHDAFCPLVIDPNTGEGSTSDERVQKSSVLFGLTLHDTLASEPKIKMKQQVHRSAASYVASGLLLFHYLEKGALLRKRQAAIAFPPLRVDLGSESLADDSTKFKVMHRACDRAANVRIRWIGVRRGSLLNF